MENNPYRDLVDNRVIPMTTTQRNVLDGIRSKMDPATVVSGEWNLDATYNLPAPEGDEYDDLDG